MKNDSDEIMTRMKDNEDDLSIGKRKVNKTESWEGRMKP